MRTISGVSAAPVTFVDETLPPSDSGGWGRLRRLALDAILLGRPAELPRGCEDLLDWAAERTSTGEAVGLDPTGFDDATFETLRRAGLPFASLGRAPEESGLRIDSTVDIPAAEDGGVRCPPPSCLNACSSLQLKPLRMFVADRFGCRLQTGPGCCLSLWNDRVLLIACGDFTYGGFLHGPARGQRNTIDILPGDWQEIGL